jgi:hypothetical protein
MAESEWKAELRRQLETLAKHNCAPNFGTSQQEEKIGVNLWSYGFNKKQRSESSGKIGFTGERSRSRA